jgi:SRSO17 transposase
MPPRSVDRSRVDGYVERLAAVLGHADRRAPLEAYLTGLLLPGERKSVEPMAARVAPREVSRTHQSMHHFVASAPWDERELLAVARDYALAALERHAPVGAWVVDDTAIPKKGNHSVGVTWQYCGVLGKEANCQVAVSVSLVNKTMSVPAAWRLYLPEQWAEDRARRAAAGVPSEVVFKRKWEIALEEIETLLEEDLPPAPLVADAGFGNSTAFRDGISRLGLSYAVGVQRDLSVWPPGKAPLPPRDWSGRGRPPTRVRRDSEHRPISVKALAHELPSKSWKVVRWREGTKGAMSSRFAAVRVRAAHRDNLRSEPRPEEWLLMEWPSAGTEPTKYWLSTVPKDVDIAELVALAKIRWRIERDYQELKDELGLDHYEGRGWRGFHHHGVLLTSP